MSEQQIDCTNDSKQQEDLISYFFRIENMENIDKIIIQKELYDNTFETYLFNFSI